MQPPLSVLDLSPVGAGVAPRQAIRDSIELARTADALGYTRYWFAEHHNMANIATSAPEIPTATQLGYPKLQILGWYVFFAPAKLPAPLVDAWGTELKAVLALPEVQKKLTDLGLDVETSTPAEFTQRMTADLARWKTIIDSIGYKAQ